MDEAKLHIVESPGRTVKRARELRRDQTGCEAALWEALRGKRLGGLKFRRQCPLGNYVVDFLCAERMLIVEIDGEYHDDADQRLFDQQRSAFLESYGYQIIRFRNDEVVDYLDSVLNAILEAAALDGTPLS